MRRAHHDCGDLKIEHQSHMLVEVIRHTHGGVGQRSHLTTLIMLLHQFNASFDFSHMRHQLIETSTIDFG